MPGASLVVKGPPLWTGGALVPPVSLGAAESGSTTVALESRKQPHSCQRDTDENTWLASILIRFVNQETGNDLSRINLQTIYEEAPGWWWCRCNIPGTESYGRPSMGVRWTCSCFPSSKAGTDVSILAISCVLLHSSELVSSATITATRARMDKASPLTPPTHTVSRDRCCIWSRFHAFTPTISSFCIRTESVTDRTGGKAQTHQGCSASLRGASLQLLGTYATL
ncbi:hypothetical protein QBC32DRAFT_353694 [Pseudoneurospora amorphoporcata]|uniref:Uncharacterized protein n=1 Tax=Pseudoneurospora amorphoporcata TaxID=241081 RepID=A0AAN6NKR3_9PEZI|nr:hypothetical protein QBC32DRAFT_353694 [Pseudoneurospora amorphoporcata]